jgi:hypothetical protein
MVGGRAQRKGFKSVERGDPGGMNPSGVVPEHLAQARVAVPVFHLWALSSERDLKALGWASVQE